MLTCEGIVFLSGCKVGPFNAVVVSFYGLFLDFVGGLMPLKSVCPLVTKWPE